MASYTTNYGLHQWVSGDDFLRTDFNTDFQKLDNALAGLEAGKTKAVWGQYTGDGASSRLISLGFTPALVVVTNQEGLITQSSYVYGGIAVTGSASSGVEIAENGFLVKNSGTYILCNYARPDNNLYREYLYIAIK